tara:strand:+ start:3252 stop:4583 length:1332 start_codon:yes stop_codon:yes gene_type:complete
MKIKLTDIQIKQLVTEAALADPMNTEKISSPFGPRWGRNHNGVDIIAKSGTPIKSPAAGVVDEACCQSERTCGGRIRIKHDNGLTTRYCHVKSFNVSKGQRVNQGQVIGTSGGGKRDIGRGNSMGAHLHYEVYKDGKPVDPIANGYITGKYSQNADAPVKPEGVIAMKGDGMYGVTSDIVRDIQSMLVSRNYILPRFGVDGKFGPETQQAVEAFQTDYMGKVTGMVDKPMKEKLGNEVNVNLKPERNDLLQVQKLSKEGEFDNFSPVVKGAILDASIKHGVDVDVLATIANIESGGNPGAVNKRSQASGLYQVLPRYFKTYGLDATTVFNPTDNADKAAAKLKDKIISLNTFLGRPPTPSELYVAHNQGTTGFKVIKLACDSYGSLGGILSLRKASVELGKSESFGDHVYNNMVGNKGGTPCAFLNTWTKLYSNKQIKLENLA